MAIYGIWNNKGGVGKSYLTFQIAAEYAIQHPDEKVLVIDLCPQANSSTMLLGGMFDGEKNLAAIHAKEPLRTISGYIGERIMSPYISPSVGASYVKNVHSINDIIPENLYLVVGDEQLEIQASRVSRATVPGPQEAWQIVHLWIRDLIDDIRYSWNVDDCAVFIDCNPSFSIYTELAMSASDRLLIPFSADGSSKRAVKAVLALVYGERRHPGDPHSEFFKNSQRMSKPGIYMYIGNRLTQMNLSSASAFKTVVQEICEEIWSVWQSNPSFFRTHPSSSHTPANRREFKRMFQYEVNDANTASVISGAMGIPISLLTAGPKPFGGKTIMVNQTQLDKQVPNIQELVRNIE